MYQREITQEQVVACVSEMMSTTGEPDARSIATTPTTASNNNSRTLSSSDNKEISVVVAADHKTVVTTFRTTQKIVAFPADQALTLKKLGLLQEMRTQLAILLHYNNETESFELSGNPRAVDMAIRRLKSHKKTKTHNSYVVKVPSATNTCGKIIGRRGCTINLIQKVCNIRSIDVQWDKETKQIVLTTITLLNYAERGNLYRLVDDVIHNHPLETLELGREPYNDVDSPALSKTDDKVSCKGSRPSRKAKAFAHASKTASLN